MGLNICPICGKRLVKGVCPDCGGSFDETDELLDGLDNYNNYETNTVQNEEPVAGDNMKVYVSNSSPKKISVDNKKNKTIIVVGLIIMVMALVANTGIIPIVLGIALRVITKKRIFSFLTFIAIVCEIFYFLF